MRTARMLLGFAATAFLLAGCSNLDDLRVTNQYPFAVTLREGSYTIGTVAPGKTDTFDNAGGYKGHADDTIHCLNPQGKDLGLLGKLGHDIQRESKGSLNGSGVLVVVLGP